MAHPKLKVERPDYRAKIQYVQEDHTKPLTPKEITFIKQVTGKFLFYGRAIDIIRIARRCVG
jgi:hypothetical protein